ncbi:MAG: thiamine phosphate synthase [Myxococcota bacterium]
MTAGDDGHGRDLLSWMGPLAQAGLRSILIREPHVPAPRLDVLCDAAGAEGLDVWVHDRHPHARHRSEGLHLSAAGSLADPARPFGQSCHNAAELRRAFAAGARYALLSPVFQPTSKPDDRRPPLGVEGFVSLAAGRPVWALGGITLARAAALHRAGGRGVAVLGGIFGQPDPRSAAKMVTKLLATWSDGT